MLTSTKIENYKCFVSKTIALAPLTVLTGYNAAGKSSALQPLLIMSQALKLGGVTEDVPLNGALVRLGTVADVMAFNARDRFLRFGFATEQANVDWTLGIEDGPGARSLRVIEPALEPRTTGGEPDTSAAAQLKMGDSPLLSLLRSLREVVYLGATRTGVAEVSQIPDTLGTNADVGSTGEYAAWLYARSVDDEIDQQRRHGTEEGLTLRRQLDAYLSDLFPKGQATADLVPRTSLAWLGFRSSTQSGWMRPINTGYGLTHAFPILVALLLAKKHQVLVFDSPEAHLHPSAQSRLGAMLARFASAGIQILVETHSDHVVNGIRLAVQKEALSNKDVVFHFFDNDTDGRAGHLQTLRVNSRGSVSNWPVGFFDQSERDLTFLSELE